MDMEQKFTIRRADKQDLDAIVSLMEMVKAGMTRPEWYVTESREWVELRLDELGFIILAETEHGETAGFFIVDFPGRGNGAAEDNLGKELLLSEEGLRLTAHMDSAAVHPDFRGNHLQDRMLKAAEAELQNHPEQYLLCTIHPDNHSSLNTMLRNGYVIIKTAEKYGGLCRHILYKKKEAVRPKLLVSACLLGISCRYNEKWELNEELVRLMQDADLIPVCPESIGGLSTPRVPAERVGEQVITKTGVDVTREYCKGAAIALHLAKLYGCRCAVLKERSPSCGSGMIYDGTYTGKLVPGDGVAAELLKKHGIQVFGESKIGSCRRFLGI